MREIQFRGQRVDNGEWVYGDLITNSKKLYIHPKANMTKVSESGLSKLVVMHKVIPETVGQYAGLTGKNGKKIFEGDIVRKFHNYTGETGFYPVVYEHGTFFAKCDETAGMAIGDIAHSIEVVGNVHDNPELLKGEKK